MLNVQKFCPVERVFALIIKRLYRLGQYGSLQLEMGGVRTPIIKFSKDLDENRDVDINFNVSTAERMKILRSPNLTGKFKLIQDDTVFEREILLINDLETDYPLYKPTEMRNAPKLSNGLLSDGSAVGAPESYFTEASNMKFVDAISDVAAFGSRPFMAYVFESVKDGSKSWTIHGPCSDHFDKVMVRKVSGYFPKDNGDFGRYEIPIVGRGYISEPKADNPVKEKEGTINDRLSYETSDGVVTTPCRMGTNVIAPDGQRFSGSEILTLYKIMSYVDRAFETSEEEANEAVNALGLTMKDKIITIPVELHLNKMRVKRNVTDLVEVYVNRDKYLKQKFLRLRLMNDNLCLLTERDSSYVMLSGGEGFDFTYLWTCAKYVSLVCSNGSELNTLLSCIALIDSACFRGLPLDIEGFKYQIAHVTEDKKTEFSVSLDFPFDSKVVSISGFEYSRDFTKLKNDGYYMIRYVDPFLNDSLVKWDDPKAKTAFCLIQNVSGDLRFTYHACPERQLGTKGLVNLSEDKLVSYVSLNIGGADGRAFI